jgi:hypothetical protein
LWSAVSIATHSQELSQFNQQEGSYDHNWTNHIYGGCGKDTVEEDAKKDTGVTAEDTKEDPVRRNAMSVGNLDVGQINTL